MMAKKDRKNQYPAYAVTGDDGKERPEYQYPAYAVKSDDGKNQQYPISKKPMLPTTAMMAKNQTETRINLFYYKEAPSESKYDPDKPTSVLLATSLNFHNCCLTHNIVEVFFMLDIKQIWFNFDTSDTGK